MTLLIVVLVFGATYMANLASLFTSKQVIIGGPTSIDQLKNARACAPSYVIGNRLPTFVADLRLATDEAADFLPAGTDPATVHIHEYMNHCQQLLAANQVWAIDSIYNI